MTPDHPLRRGCECAQCGPYFERNPTAPGDGAAYTLAKFLACPFCGGSVSEYAREGADHFRFCWHCRCGGPRKPTSQEALTAWDTRAAPIAPGQAEILALVDRHANETTREAWNRRAYPQPASRDAVIAWHVSNSAVSHYESFEAGVRWAEAQATPVAPVPATLYEHDDGRHAVAHPGAAFLAGDLAWHRVGPVEVHGGGAPAASDALRGLDTSERVRFYEHDFYVLSNFSAFHVAGWGRDFDTAEHAYHWTKFPGRTDIQDAIQCAPSAHEAFKLAERMKPFRRIDWDDVKVGFMRAILHAKAAQHEYVRTKLLATGDRELVEDSWRDDYWGWGPNRDGQNMLGKLWMEARAALAATKGSR